MSWISAAIFTDAIRYATAKLKPETKEVKNVNAKPDQSRDSKQLPALASGSPAGSNAVVEPVSHYETLKPIHTSVAGAFISYGSGLYLEDDSAVKMKRRFQDKHTGKFKVPEGKIKFQPHIKFEPKPLDADPFLKWWEEMTALDELKKREKAKAEADRLAAEASIHAREVHPREVLPDLSPEEVQAGIVSGVELFRKLRQRSVPDLDQT